jgi:uncharacterized protein YraI
MRKTVLGAVIAAGVTLIATPSLSCVALSPNGSDTTNIRSGPSRSYNVQDEIISGIGKVIYCGHSRIDEDGEDFIWLKVKYRINDRYGWNTGFVASSVVTQAGEEGE